MQQIIENQETLREISILVLNNDQKIVGPSEI